MCIFLCFSIHKSYMIIWIVHVLSSTICHFRYIHILIIVGTDIRLKCPTIVFIIHRLCNHIIICPINRIVLTVTDIRAARTHEHCRRGIISFWNYNIIDISLTDNYFSKETTHITIIAFKHIP